MTAGNPTKFYSSNSQRDGVKTLRRFEFEFQGNSYVFNLNPEEYTQTEPSRATITQTKGGAWMDDFGSGIVQIKFKGITGFKSSSLDQNQHEFLRSLISEGGGNAVWAKSEFERQMVGFLKFKELRDLIRACYDNFVPGEVILPSKELIFHNYTDGEHWIVYPETFDLFRSVSRPLLYSYSISLWCLRPANQPAEVDRDGRVGKLDGLAPTWEGGY